METPVTNIHAQFEERYRESRTRTLYKYRAFNENGWKLLEDNELYFASARNFNDPFDALAVFRFDFSIDDLQRISTAKCGRVALSRSEAKELQSSLKGRAAIRKMRDYLWNKFGAISFSEDPLSVLMWSHYSMNHSGFCVGLKSDILYDALGGQKCDSYGCVYWRKIGYHDTPAEVIPTLHSLIREDELGLFTRKATLWSYEQENRFIKTPIKTHKCRKVYFPPEALESIFLGSKISNSDLSRVKELAKRMDVKPKLFRCNCDVRTFRLFKVELTY